jgi:DNA-binding transcriptional LysR family regulator
LVVLPVFDSELRIDWLFQLPLVAALPEDSDLAKTALVCIEEVSHQPIIWFGKLISRSLYQHFINCCQRAGFTPDITHEVSTVMEMLDCIAAGFGIGFVKDTIPSHFRPQGIVFREFAVTEVALDIGIVYRDGDCAESVLALITILRQMAGRYCGKEVSPTKAVLG